MSLQKNVKRRPPSNRMLRGTTLAGVAVLLAGLITGPAAYGTSPVPPEPTPTESAETPLPPADEAPPAAVPSEPAPTETVEPVEETDGPVNLTLPTVDGPAVVGKPVTVFTGEWTGVEEFGTLLLEWTADGEVVHETTAPPGKTFQFWIPGTAGGKSLVLSVRPGLGEPVTTEPLDVGIGTIDGVGWTNLIIGKPAVGQELSLHASSWSDIYGVVPVETYQWYRGTSAIPGAVFRTYTPVAADLGQKLWAEVTLSAPGYAPTGASSVEVTVGPGALTAPVPSITGTARVGQVQTANPGIWPAGTTLSYQWYRGTTPITGAVGRTYTTVPADNGQAVKVRVRGTKTGYTSVYRDSAARTIAAGVITATTPVTVSGTHRYGQTLKVSQGWSPAPAVIKYQWYRAGIAVSGATGSSLWLNSSYIGQTVSVRVTVSKPGYTTVSTTTVRKTVGKAVFAVTAAPRITGTAKVGYTLTTSLGTYSPAPAAYGFQWYRNGTAISGATNRSYKLTTTDGGKQITARVYAKANYYETRSTLSAAVAIPAVPVVVLGGDGIYKVGTTLKPGLYKATGTGEECQWARLNSFVWDPEGNNMNAHYIGPAKTYVQILPTDVGFRTEGCGKWTTVTSAGARATSITANGTYRVGIDILPGTYYAYGTGDDCYWETLSGFSYDLDELISNYYGPQRTIVTIPADVKGFFVHGCGTLTRK
ncbi:hypothetical protein [uncultured Arthrobacter sp.]|nr:hypothetical protein [uncultured Arthrobacter sp.]